eukprot:CAMPEP_0117419516 /NCGR_PEP_ID=MMETSP0758-20121206/1057_1 /TAXON_ID=63605 /ORGANISM="Percolomonas cosmopolitus, Strain AE-1 (ATCC 50343)" /LENGTH=129 /DNA_ID=CAMNT_0005200617 /DNA_START=1868 /DNA_END=2254 /DNA_ORIENTATION=-
MSVYKHIESIQRVRLRQQELDEEDALKRQAPKTSVAIQTILNSTPNSISSSFNRSSLGRTYSEAISDTERVMDSVSKEPAAKVVKLTKESTVHQSSNVIQKVSKETVVVQLNDAVQPDIQNVDDLDDMD